MAILSNGKFYGFLCSAKETGRKLANGAKEYVENFVSGFAGHGWKIWEYVKGKWKLEIDTIVVRETMLVFEMLISKVRAIIGAQAITQGHGKVKSVRISDDSTEYLIELEDENISIVAHDFVRCQTFGGEKTKLYHVEVDSVDIETKTLHVSLTEFEQDESDNIFNIPESGDELVQFGNSQNKSRQSAIYMHADETGQPAIDVMFDIDSKNWENKVKVRVGGGIPGTDNRGFYVENGMIKGTDTTGHTTFCLHPDGTAELGDGSTLFKPDKSGYIAGGSISWQWNETKQKYVCTFSDDAFLTWDNLSDVVKENLKGEPGEKGKDANLLDWVEDWNGTVTDINGQRVITPKIFSGRKNVDNTLTGVAIGSGIITIDGVEKTGVFGIKNGKITFSLDSETGDVTFDGSVIARIIETSGLSVNGDFLDQKYAIQINISADEDDRRLNLYALKTYGSVLMKQGYYDGWNTPGVLMAMTIKVSTTAIDLTNGWWGPIFKGKFARLEPGVYKITHNLGHDTYTASVTPTSISPNGNYNLLIASVVEKTSSYLTVRVVDVNGTKLDATLYVAMFGRN